MKVINLITLALIGLLILVFYDLIDNRLKRLEATCLDPQPLVRIYQVPHSTAKVYVVGEEIDAPND